ncbi:MAG: RNA-binding S4 domain-containing protein [Chloroflexi bacterium]|nr:RNA-binding S4 domain-containing protein [Chloroflexota bacterium]
MTENAPQIRLDQFLKFVGAAGTGGEAKFVIQTGEVKVNGQTETRRSHKLANGDVVLVGGRTYTVNL